MTDTELSALLRRQATEIAREGHNGWGNTMTQAAAELERLRGSLENLEVQAIRDIAPGWVSILNGTEYKGFVRDSAFIVKVPDDAALP